MGSRLYDEFMKKLKVPPVRRHKKNDDGSSNAPGNNTDLVIAIPLKGGQGQAIELDDNFVKVI